MLSFSLNLTFGVLVLYFSVHHTTTCIIIYLLKKSSLPCDVCQAARSKGGVAPVGYSSEYREAPSPFTSKYRRSDLLHPSICDYHQYEQREGGTWTNKDVNVGYVPSGMSVHEWHELKRAENKQTKKKNFAAVGPTSFKSRSLQG